MLFSKVLGQVLNPSEINLSLLSYRQVSNKRHWAFNVCGIYLTNKILLVKHSLVPDDELGVVLDTSDELKLMDLQDYITKISGIDFNRKGLLDFTLDCPIYSHDGNVSHLPVSTLNWLIEAGNNNILMGLNLIENGIPEGTSEDDIDTNNYVGVNQWQWEICAVNVFDC